MGQTKKGSGEDAVGQCGTLLVQNRGGGEEGKTLKMNVSLVHTSKNKREKRERKKRRKKKEEKKRGGIQYPR